MSSQTQALRLAVEPLRSIAAASISTVYMGIGTVLEHPIRMFILMNLTDARLIFSFNGIDDHLVLPENSNLTFDVAANKTNSSGFFLGENKRIYVKRDQTPTTGNVHLTLFYGGEV